MRDLRVLLRHRLVDLVRQEAEEGLRVRPSFFFFAGPSLRGVSVGSKVAKKPEKYCKKNFKVKHKGAKLKTPVAFACPHTCADYLDEKGIWCASSR